MTDSRPLAVFDIDGVLADVGHRLHLLDAPPATRRGRWEAFFAAAPDDPPLPQGVQLAQQAALDCEVVYVTGRPERCRADTLAWLARQDLPQGRLGMRRDTDRRPARQAKPQLLRHLAGDRTVAVVVDDDPEVCTAYERAGWPVLRATWMPAAPRLELAQETDGRT